MYMKKFIPSENHIVFILKASQAVTAPIFTSKSLASLGGRMDLVARAIIAAIAKKSGIRKNILFISIFEGSPNPPITFIIDSNKFHKTVISEKNVANIILTTLRNKSSSVAYILNASFREIITYCLNLFGKKKTVYLCENGIDIRTLPRKYIDQIRVFIIGDHRGIDKENEKWLEKKGLSKICLGPISYLASHVITIVLEEKTRAKENS